MNANATVWFGSIFAALFAVMGVKLLTPSRTKLSSRLRPYASISRSALGRNPDVSGVSFLSGGKQDTSSVERLLQPLTETLARWITGILGQGNHAQLALRLRQAGIGVELSDEQRVHDYRIRQLTQTVIMASGGVLVALVLKMPPAIGLLLLGAGAVLGSTREPAKLGKTINDRTARMRIELYTINQQLAMNLRTGGSSIQAVQRIVRRGHGEIVSELQEALRLHERGMSATAAFTRLAENTPEPFAARMYKMLSAGAERGADLAEGLLALSLDVRDARRDSLKRSATRRRGLMILPTVVLMAPTMLIFIAAPLPSIIFGIKR